MHAELLCIAYVGMRVRYNRSRLFRAARLLYVARPLLRPRYDWVSFWVSVLLLCVSDLVVRWFTHKNSLLYDSAVSARRRFRILMEAVGIHASSRHPYVHRDRGRQCGYASCAMVGGCVLFSLLIIIIVQPFRRLEMPPVC